MEYELKITKRTPNPDYMKQYVEWQQKNMRSFPSEQVDAPQPFLSHEVLAVTVDEATFAAIRKAAVETF